MQEMRDRHDRRERIKTITTTQLFGRYEILSILGSGSTGTVYLARHLKLKTLCAIKCIPKSCAPSSSYLSEARLLKILRHPGIPILYDYEEDESSFYLIEEYFQGDSLEVFVLHQPIISETFIIQTGIELCELLSYLHSIRPAPVIYQDLKPEHILVCTDSVKLIDFGAAAFLSEAGNNHAFYGTEEYSAPEVKKGQKISIRSDLYSLGKVLAFLVNGNRSSYHPKLLHIIQTLTAESEEQRFSSAEEVRDSLLSLKKDMCQPHLSKQIAVFSSEAGIGATHLAVSIVSVLNKNGYRSCYQEKDPAQKFGKLSGRHSFSCSGNALSRGYFRAVPNFGEGIASEVPAEDILVKDYGVYRKSLIELDYEETLIFVMGSRDWELDRTYAIGEQIQYRNHALFVCNYGDRQAARKLAHHFDRKVYCFPLDCDPLRVTREKESFCLDLLGLQKGGPIPFHFGKRGTKKNLSPSVFSE